jgi:hypothetical protein
MLPDFPDTDNQQGCCTLLDIETFLEYLDCVLDVDDLHRIIFVEDDPDKPISFSLGLAVHLKKGCNVNDAIYNQATSLPNALPSAVWCTLCLDKTLDLKGRLSQAYDDYFVTKITVNSKGHLFNASF